MNTLTPQEIAEVIADAKVAHIGVIADGEPYVTPISFVALGGGLAFRCYAGRRLNAIRDNPKVSIEMSVVDADTGAWRSVVASGNATIVEDSEQEATVIQQLLHRYSDAFQSLLGDSPPSLAQAYVVRVDFDTVSGRGSGTFLTPRTRPGRL